MTEPVDTAVELRGKLLRRLGIAAGLVIFLLVTLAFFDYLAAPPEEEHRVYTQPVPVAPRKEVTQPVKPAENLPAPPEPAPAPPAPEPAPETAEKAPAPPRAAEPKPTAPRVVEPAPPLPKAAPAPRLPAPEASVAPADKTPAAPSARVVPAPVAPAPARETPPKTVAVPAAVPAPVAPRLFSGFLLQAGVFNNAQRAEELHARLTLSGIPSSLETRVQIGPFRSKQEAEAAQEKLKGLGVETVLVAPRGARH